MEVTDGDTLPCTAMADAALVLVLVPVRGAYPLRVPLIKRITSIGADPTADIRLPTAPAHWAIVHRADDGVDVTVATTGEKRRLRAGEALEADGITLSLESVAAARERERSIEELVSALAAVESPERAVELLLTGLIGASGADLGAVILVEGEGYTVAAARDRSGEVLERADELLSDTIVR